MLPSACSTRIASAQTIGISAGKFASSKKAGALRRTALTTRSTTSADQPSFLNSSAPALIRVMASRLRIIAVETFGLRFDLRKEIGLCRHIHSVPVIEQARCRPEIDASGVRKSCDTDASRIFGPFRFRLRCGQLSSRSAREARSIATAVCSARVDSRASSSGLSTTVSLSTAMPTTPMVPRCVRRGMKCQRAIARAISVPNPAEFVASEGKLGRFQSCAYSSVSSGGHAAEATILPFLFEKNDGRTAKG